MNEGESQGPRESVFNRVKHTVGKIYYGLGFPDGQRQATLYNSSIAPQQLIDTLYAQLNSRKGLAFKDKYILSQYERSKIYQGNDSGGKVLVLASGTDGIPGQVYGEENVVLLSLDESRYFGKFVSKLRNVQNTAKIEANMFALPFAKDSFSTVVINEMNYMLNEMIEKSSAGQSFNELLTQARGVIKTGGKFIITDIKSQLNLTPDQEKDIEKLGWRFQRGSYSSVLNHCILTAI